MKKAVVLAAVLVGMTCSPVMAAGKVGLVKKVVYQTFHWGVCQPVEVCTQASLAVLGGLYNSVKQIDVNLDYHKLLQAADTPKT